MLCVLAPGSLLGAHQATVGRFKHWDGQGARICRNRLGSRHQTLTDDHRQRMQQGIPSPTRPASLILAPIRKRLDVAGRLNDADEGCNRS